MFSLDIIDSDSFLDMPASTRCLYYDLGMRADDDGFVSPKKILRLTNASVDDLNVLITKKFVIPFDSGVLVIKDWKMNNYIQKDRYTETIYKEEKALLDSDQNGSYILDTGKIQNVYMLDTQDRLGKVRLGKVSKEKKNTLSKYSSINSLKEEDFEKIADAYKVPVSFVKSKYDDMINWHESTGKTKKNWYATLRNWVKADSFKLRKEDNQNGIKRAIDASNL